MPVEKGPTLTAFEEAFARACVGSTPPTKARVGYDTYDRIKAELGPVCYSKAKHWRAYGMYSKAAFEAGHAADALNRKQAPPLPEKKQGE